MRFSDLITAGARREPFGANGAHPAADVRVEYTLDEVALDRIGVDRSYQRDVDKAHVARLVADWQPNAVGALLVGRRGDGSLWLVDGQHRYHAMVQLGWTHATCEIWESAGPQQEADLFHLRNTHRKINIVNLFRALLVAGDEEAVAIDATVRAAGWTVLKSLGRPSRAGQTTAVDTLESLYRRDHLVLYRALQLLIRTWPEEPKIGTGVVIRGMFLFLAYGGDRVSDASFIKKLATETAFGVLLRRAKTRAVEHNLSPAMGVAHEIAAVYNARLREDRRVTFDRAD